MISFNFQGYATKCALSLYVLVAVAGAQPTAALKTVSGEFVFEAPPFLACHAATLVETNDQGLLAAWFAGTAEGNPDVSIWTASKNQVGWTKPRVVAEGAVDGRRYACWNPVLARAADGSLFLFYRVGPSPREWFGMLKSSRDEGETWSMPTRLPAGFLGPIRSKPARLSNGDLLCPSSVEIEDSWSVHMEVLSDSTSSWKKIEVDTDSHYQVIQPTILRYSKSRLQILCRSRNNIIVEAWSDNDGASWSSLTPTSLPNPNSAIDAQTLSSGLQLLVYNPKRIGTEWWTGRNKLSVALSSDGQNWQDKIVLEDAERGEFSYPAVIQTSDGLLHVLYTWNRTNIKHVVLEVHE